MRKKNDRSLFSNAEKNRLCFGCPSCVDFQTCGGLSVKAPLMDCLDLCECAIEERHRCDRICPKSPANFVSRYREVGGWELDVPEGRTLPNVDLPEMIPIVKDRACRTSEFAAHGAAVPLQRIFSMRSGNLSAANRTSLDTRFQLATGNPLVITGVGYDDGLERYWEQGRAADLARQIAGLNVALMTSPNFSLFTDVPRHENLYNMKRIVICWEELIKQGVPTALHLNGRTDHDWVRWTNFVIAHHEISSVAFEFTSGSAGRRARWYVRKLRAFAAKVERKLTLVIRGGTAHLGELAGVFDRVVVLSMKPYVATMRRQRLEWRANEPLRWHSDPTPEGTALDALFSYNVSVAARMVEYKIHRGVGTAAT
jgi:hypothetical protein